MFDELLKTSTKPKSDQKKNLEWKNHDNDKFYGDIGADGLIKLSHKAGLFTGCDIKKLFPLWKNKSSILDIGSGFGRVIGALIDNNFKGHITGIERNQSLFKYTFNLYNDMPNITLFNQNSFSYINDNTCKKFDIVFLLWSGLADYSPKEQNLMMKTFSGILENNGYIIIDTMPMGVQPLDTERFEQRSFLTRSENNSIVRTYEPSYDEMCEYAKKSELKLFKIEKLLTDTQRARWLYVFTKLSTS
jgi:SAM-dependent methyltransferase